ncbi:MAG: pilus assembly protein PilO [Gammaproteobacteria bacterium]|nr:pilus assembly protein PilO [Gammaproteobacteria bacterium]
MKMSDINNLTFDNIGTWPIPFKVAFTLLICGAILGLAYWKDISPSQLELEGVQKEETALKQTFESKQKKAANLNALKQQLGDIKETFGDLLKRLPNKTEVAALLVDISQQGLGAGLEFELFKPGAERPAEFYVELPIQIKVIGDYHAFGTFISGMSDLPRIVTNHDIKIVPVEDGNLSLETIAKTYRYMDEEEELAEAEKAQAAKAKGAKKKTGAKKK